MTTNNGKIATIALEVTVYEDRVECYAKGTKWTSVHGGKCIKTTPYASQYGPDPRWSESPVGDLFDKSLKQAILEATEPQIDFSMEDLGLVEAPAR
jgi:hypothetical protein